MLRNYEPRAVNGLSTMSSSLAIILLWYTVQKLADYQQYIVGLCTGSVCLWMLKQKLIMKHKDFLLLVIYRDSRAVNFSLNDSLPTFSSRRIGNGFGS